jgi:hypothetical protein
MLGDGRSAPRVLDSQPARCLNSIQALHYGLTPRIDWAQLQGDAIEQVRHAKAAGLFQGMAKVGGQRRANVIIEALVGQKLLRKHTIDVHIGLLLIEHRIVLLKAVNQVRVREKRLNGR